MKSYSEEAREIAASAFDAYYANFNDADLAAAKARLERQHSSSVAWMAENKGKAHLGYVLGYQQKIDNGAATMARIDAEIARRAAKKAA